MADSSGNNPLHYAAAYGFDEIVRLLHDSNCELNPQNSWRLTPLTVALQKGHYKVMETLMSYNNIDINCKDDEGNTLVSLALASLSVESYSKIEFLVNVKNADLNIVNLQGNSPLHILYNLNLSSLIAPRKDFENDVSYLNRYNSELAKLKDLQINVAKLLIPKVDINIVNSSSKTALMIAFEKNDVQLAQLLISSNKIDFDKVFTDDSNLYHQLALIPLNEQGEKCFNEMLNSLKKSKADINGLDEFGFTPIARVFENISGLISSEHTKYVSTETTKKQQEKYRKEKKSSSKKKSSKKNSKIEIEQEEEEEEDYNEDNYEMEEEEVEEENQLNLSPVLNLPLSEEEISKIYESAVKIYKKAVEMAKSRIKVFEGLKANSKFSIQKLKAYRNINPTEKVSPYGQFGGYTAMHFLCKSGIPDLIKEYSSKINEEKDSKGNTPLKVFVDSLGGEFVVNNKNLGKNVDILEFLLAKGTDPNIPNNEGISSTLAVAFKTNSSLVFKSYLPIIVKYKGNLNSTSKKNKNPLNDFASKRDLETCEFLLQNGADPNFQDLLGRTALHHAINSAPTDADASFELESLLFSYNADAKIKDKRMRTPLHYAFVKINNPFENSKIDPIETVSSLLSFTKDVNEKDSFGNTPLHYAAQRGSMISGIYLMNANAEIEVQNKDGNNPLGQSFIFGHSDFATLLIQRIKNVTRQINLFKKVEAKKDEGGKKNEDEMEIESNMSEQNNNLFGGGFNFGFKNANPFARFPAKKSSAFNFGQNNNNVDVNLKWNNIVDSIGEGEHTYFKLAIKHQWQGVAYLLIQQGYPLNKAIDDAIINKSFQLVLTLLYKATPESIRKHLNHQKQNILHLLSIHSNESTKVIMKILTDLNRKKIDFAALSNEGKTFLHYAAENQNIGMIRESLKFINEKTLNAKDNKGITLIGYLLEKISDENLSLIKSLHNAKADIKIPFEISDEKYNIFSYLVKKGSKNFEFYNWLLDNGLDCNFTDSKGQNSLFYAISHNSKKLVQYIMKLKLFNLKLCIDKEKKSPLHFAVRPLPVGRFELNKVFNLLVKDFDVNLKDSSGRTPLDWAIMVGASDIEKILTKHNAVKGSKAKKFDIWIPTSETLVFEPQLDYYADASKYISEHPIKEKEEDPYKVDSNYQSNTKGVLMKDQNDEAYDVWLTKVDVQRGYWSQYLFYKMQIIFEQVRGVYILFTRWGSIGTVGQYQQTPFSNFDECYKEFSSIFKSKTGNLYEERDNFTKVHGKYNLITFEKSSTKEDLLSKLEFQDNYPISKLENSMYNAIRQFSHAKTLTAAISNFQYDNSKIPLHLLSRDSLLKAKEILLKLQKLSKKVDALRRSGSLDQVNSFISLKEEIAQLSSSYYEMVPTHTYNDSLVPMIEHKHQISNQIRNIETLLNIETAAKIIIGSCFKQKEMNPVDYCFKSLGIKMATLHSNSFEFSIIKDYIFMSADPLNIELVNVFACERKEESERVTNLDNKILLWHGTSLPNFMGILTQGLRINAPNAMYLSGQLFGYGVYFADTFIKSLGYSQGYLSNCSEDNSLFLLLCEVSLGKVMETKKYDFEGKLNPKFDSLKGCGRTGPDLRKFVILDNGVKIPTGELVDYKQVGNSYSYLQHSEYVVYKEEQVKIKYLVEVKSKNSF